MREARWHEALSRMLARMDQTGRTVTRGFPHFAGACLLNSSLAREVALAGACGLASSYNPRAEALPRGPYYLFENLHVLAGALNPAEI